MPSAAPAVAGLTLALAQEDAAGGGDAGAEEVITGETDRPLTEWLEQRIDNDLVLTGVEYALEPALQILVIVVIAWIARLLVRRMVRRAVRRVKEPEVEDRRRVRERFGLDVEARAPHSARRAQRADALGALAGSVSSLVIWTIAVFMILGTFGISLGPLIAGAGIVGVALGFGAQGLVRDFLSGVFMLIEDQYGVGDIIDVGEAIGVVEGISLRTTRIRDLEGSLWHVPNGEISRVSNMSQKWARVLLDVQVAYATDVDGAIEVIEAVAGAMAEEEDYRDLFLDPPEVWGVEALGADGIDIRLVIKTKPAEQWAIGRELRRRIKAAFDAAEVEIPFPQRTVWLRTEKPVAVTDTDEQGAPVASRPDAAGLERALEQAAKGDRGRAAMERQDLPTPEQVIEEQAGEEETGDAVENEDTGRS